MFVNPSDLSATELRSLVSLFEYGDKPAPISSGFAFAKGAPISWRILRTLGESNLVSMKDGFVKLTKAGEAIGRNFQNKAILGYD